jgi:valyl-tRNA synthetase
VVETVEKLNKAFAEFRFDGMADAIYHFVWDQFCDWYLELIKPELSVDLESDSTEDEQLERGDETRRVAGWVLDQILVMLHPFMPFVTEELWHSLDERKYDLIHAKWPEPKAAVDSNSKRDISWVVDLIQSVRTARSEMNIPSSTKLDWTITQFSDWTFDAYLTNQQGIRRLARIDRTFISKSVQGLSDGPAGLSKVFNFFKERELVSNNAIQIVATDFLAFASLDGAIDVDAERSRISKAIEAATKERDALAGRLSNAAFVEKAKPEAVEKARADHAEKAAEAERLTAALARLG